MQQYRNPPSSASSVGTQFRDFYYAKKALIEVVKEQVFTPLADVTTMPKNMGKTIKQYLYLPLLDDRNVNDQGIDATGASHTTCFWVVLPTNTFSFANASAAAAVTALNAAVVSGDLTLGASTGAADSAGSGLARVTTARTVARYTTLAAANAVIALNIGAVMQAHGGALYGSSKDIGLINAKLPVLSETGGRVNRVGFKRVDLQGSLEKLGFFQEYTQESLDFDTDEELQMHINREMIRGANEITEDMLQTDLLTSSGTVRYAGTAVSNITVKETDIITYTDIMKLGIILDNLRCPKKTTMITGSRMVDTMVIPGARYAYVGSELIPTLRSMKDLHNNPAFIDVQRYADAGKVATNEIGAIDQFRIVVAQEMQKWSGAGAATTDTTVFTTGGRVDVFPFLVVGDGSFTTIGFQTDGKSLKFKIKHLPPSENYNRDDPYGEMGFMSIKWYYGFMAQRPERIATIRTAAKI